MADIPKGYEGDRTLIVEQQGGILKTKYILGPDDKESRETGKDGIRIDGLSQAGALEIHFHLEKIQLSEATREELLAVLKASIN